MLGEIDCSTNTLDEVLAVLRKYRVSKATLGANSFEFLPDVPQGDVDDFNRALERAQNESPPAGLTDHTKVKFPGSSNGGK